MRTSCWTRWTTSPIRKKKARTSKTTATNCCRCWWTEGRAYAFALDGYWRDVGTVESYWEGHMDLLDLDVQTPFDQEAWPILTPGPHELPARLHATAHVDNGLISPGCDVRGEVVRSVLGPGVVIEEGAAVHDAVLLGNVKVEKDAQVHFAILDEGAVVGREARVGVPARQGAQPELTVVGMDVAVRAGRHVEAGAALEPADA